jgi:16S rRNA (guanine527-N7)-methyltransferase
MIDDFSSFLLNGLKHFGVVLPADSMHLLALYYSELLKWSKKINLIAKTTEAEQIIENHFLDSLTILPLLDGVGAHLLDIGSGAGFPGLVCKAAQPGLAVTLVEPRVKRVSFLGHIVRTLALTGVTILNCRIEDEAQLPSGNTFSHITSRAVTEIGPFLKMVERFAPANPQIICMKGPKWRDEMADAAATVNRSSYRLTEVVDHELPFSKAKRSLLIFKRHLNGDTFPKVI